MWQALKVCILRPEITPLLTEVARLVRKSMCITGCGVVGAPVGGRTFFTNMKMAFSGLTLILFRMTYTN